MMGAMSTHHLATLDQARRHHGELIRRAADERLGRRQRRQRRRAIPDGPGPIAGHARDG